MMSGPNCGSDGQADNDLNARSGHRLNRDALDDCGRLCLVRPAAMNVIKCVANGGFRVVEIEVHPPDITFMRDVG